MLSLFAAIITKLRELMAGEVPRVFEAIFECTLQMITKNFAVGDPRLLLQCTLRALHVSLSVASVLHLAKPCVVNRPQHALLEMPPCMARALHAGRGCDFP